MANTSSAKKAVRNAVAKKAANDSVREKVSAARKQVLKALTSGKKADKAKAITAYYKQVDKAAKSTVNVLTKNKAARMKATMARKLNAA